MSYFRGKTIGFSHRGGYWTSRYSFTPTCYGNVDNIMVSNNGRHPDNIDLENVSSLFWRHNENNTHNNFYGKQYPSKLSIVSNQGPSSVKIFKSLSIESNSNQWSGVCGTNMNPAGSPQNELQLGQIQGFIRKEGTQYGELPRDMANSDSNIDYACMVSDIVMSDQTFSVEFAVSPTHLTWDVEATTLPNVSINGGMSSIALFRDGDTFKYFNLNGEVFDYTSFTNAMQNNPVHVHAYDPVNNIVRFGAEYPNGAVDSNAVAQAISGFGMSLYVVSDPNINGDPMRGHYLYLDLVNSSTTPVETFAINVDYENTHLDATEAPKRNIATASK